MRRQVPLYVSKRQVRIIWRLHQFHLPHHRPSRRKPLEPGTSGEIIGSRHDRRRRRHKACRQPNPRPFAQFRPVRVERQVYPISDGSPGFDVACCQNQSHTTLGGLLLALENASIDLFEARVRYGFGPHQRRACPDQRRTGRDGKGERDDCSQSEGPSGLIAPHGKGARCHRDRCPDQCQPLPRCGKMEPKPDPARKSHAKPRPAIETGSFEKRLELPRRTGQETPHAPRARHRHAGLFARLPHRYRRRPLRRHASV